MLPVDVRLREILQGLCVYVCVFERGTEIGKETEKLLYR